MEPAVIFVILLVVANIASLIVCAMKERWVLFVLGFLFAVPGWIGAFLPARPGSSWERRRARAVTS
jgi:hypothetical protein